MSGEYIYPSYVVWLARLSVFLTAFGFVIGFIWPGPITGILLPLGLTIWFVTYKIISRIDRKTVKNLND